MSSALEMSLDDLIKRNRKSGSGNSRGRGRGSGPGPARRFPNRGANRSAPYTTAKVNRGLDLILTFCVFHYLIYFFVLIRF